jgi:hypothetical protein
MVPSGATPREPLPSSPNGDSEASANARRRGEDISLHGRTGEAAIVIENEEQEGVV